MSNTQPLQNNVDFVRCNLRVLKETHHELFEHLAKIPENGRAEEIRYLMRLGLMLKNGQVGGMQSSPVLMADSVALSDTSSSQIKSEQRQENKTDTIKHDKPVNPDEISLGKSDLDLGDDLLFL